MNNKQAVAFIDPSAQDLLVCSMANALRDRMERPGFMRTVFFHETNHTVREFTEREYVLARRVRRHHGVRKSISTRDLIRQFRD